MKKILIVLVVLIVVAAGIFYQNKDRILEPGTTQHQTGNETTQSAPTIAVPQGWETYRNEQHNFSVSFPKEFEVSPNGENSIMVIKTVIEPGQGPSNFIYISVVPEGAQGNDGSIYNFNKTHLDSLLSMQINEEKPLAGEDPGLTEYVTFTRLPDTRISGNYAKTFMNLKPWEFPNGTKEYRYVIDQKDRTYLIGGYISTVGHNNYSFAEDLYNQIINTVQIPQPSDDIALAQVVDNYYQRYLLCMKTPPMQATGSVSVYCQNNSGLTTEAFPQNLEKGGVAKAGADPVTCSQNPPESVQVQNANPGQNTALVVGRYSQDEVQIQVKVTKEKNEWKVDNIMCPRP